MSATVQIVIPVFPELTALDAVGPYEVLQRIPSVDVTFVGHRRGEVRTENGMMGLSADGTFEEFPAPDVIVFPGGWALDRWSTTSGCSTGCATPTPRP